MTDTYVKLRVRDQVVCVSRQFIVESPWRLSLMFDVPWEKVSGHYYVNADPESFRKVVSLLEGSKRLEDVVRASTPAQMLRLRETFRSLNCEVLEKRVQRVIRDYDRVMNKH